MVCPMMLISSNPFHFFFFFLLSLSRVPSSLRCWLLGTFPVSIPSFCLSFHHINLSLSLSLSFHSAWRFNVLSGRITFRYIIYIYFNVFIIIFITSKLLLIYDFINGFIVSLGLQTFIWHHLPLLPWLLDISIDYKLSKVVLHVGHREFSQPYIVYLPHICISISCILLLHRVNFKIDLPKY